MEERKYLKLNDVSAYKSAFHLSNFIWEVIIKWKYFAQNSVGEQFVTAIDSVSANIAEGFGRFGKKDKIRFYRIAKGSVTECFDWNEKAKVRKLIDKKTYEYIFGELQILPKSINSLIKITNQKLSL
ncbi:MAG: four helix bundle protein [Bacteroidota bacterium]